MENTVLPLESMSLSAGEHVFHWKKMVFPLKIFWGNCLKFPLENEVFPM